MLSRAKCSPRETLSEFERGDVIFHHNTHDTQYRSRESQESFGSEIEDAEDIDYANLEYHLYKQSVFKMLPFALMNSLFILPDKKNILQAKGQ